jgi:peptidoglycan/xylan/chitin deacetylase (PgdA/CDA1 family)
MPLRIPITMCHGIVTEGEKPLTVEHLDSLVRIASELGFRSIDYDDLAAWRSGSSTLPERPIMFDFDHPVRSMRYEVHDVLARCGYRGNLFIYTSPYDPEYDRPLPWDAAQEHMTWDELGELREAGWYIGAHTISHPNLSDLAAEDPDGKILAAELDRSNETIRRHLGFVPADFAFTGTSWSSVAEQEVKKRYRFGRLWIIGSEYTVDGRTIRYAELVNAAGPDEPDGGPPQAARYITEESDPYRLPSMELQALIHDPAAFRAYLEGAM